MSELTSRTSRFAQSAPRTNEQINRQDSDINPNLPRYGISMGDDIDLGDFIGGRAVDYVYIPKRTPVPWLEEIEVEDRNMTPERMDDADGSKTENSVKIKKSPLRCAADVLSRFKNQGFDILHSLTGLEEAEAITIFDVVMPLPEEDETEEEGLILEKENYLSRLVDTLAYLETSATPVIEASALTTKQKEKARTLRTELLQAGQRALAWMLSVLVESEAEVKASESGKPGKKGFDERDNRYYNETRRTKPEERPQQAQAAYGKAVGDALNGQSAGTQAVIEKMAEQQAASDARFQSFMEMMAAQQQQTQQMMAQMGMLFAGQQQAAQAAQAPPPAPPAPPAEVSKGKQTRSA